MENKLHHLESKFLTEIQWIISTEARAGVLAGETKNNKKEIVIKIAPKIPV